MISITCYNNTKHYPESKRRALMNEYREGIICCDGCEKERYMNIYLMLEQGYKHCTDEPTTEDWLGLT